MKNERLTNIELARILSMFLVLVGHANMVSLTAPTSMDLETNTLPTVFRCFVESLVILSVNVFVLISGWFTIKTSAKNVSAFLFQVVFYWGGAYLLLVLSGVASLSMANVLNCFALTKWEFFIKAYLFLFIIAPVLNTFVQHASEKTQRYVLIGFFFYSSSYGWLGGASRFFSNGYGPLLFIGLYLLAQYVRNTSKKMETPSFVTRLFSLNKFVDLGICILLSVVNTVMSLLALKFSEFYFWSVFCFINPCVIIAALYLLLFFTKVELKQSRLINGIAASSFAVYLIHSQIDIRVFFTKGVNYLYQLNDGIVCLLSILFLLLIIHVASVLIDQIRIFFWRKISIKLFDI